jgi:hypothetical protein
MRYQGWILAWEGLIATSLLPFADLVAVPEECVAAVASMRAELPPRLPACPSEQQTCFMLFMLDAGAASGLPQAVARN